MKPIQKDFKKKLYKKIIFPAEGYRNSKKLQKNYIYKYFKEY